MPEKAKLLEKLKQGNFNVPDFVYVSAENFKNKNFDKLEHFFENFNKSFKVIARSAHPCEQFFKGGTFDSLETYADVAGIEYARKRIIRSAQTVNKLSILRQNKFSRAPEIDLNDMGVIVMPFVEGTKVMSKIVANSWEFGYCDCKGYKVQTEPYITQTPHDRKLLHISRDVQKYLGFACEIEFIISQDNEVFVVQAKDISNIEVLEIQKSKRSIKLDGLRRIRKYRNYRERPVYVMDNKSLYLDVISECENIVHESGKDKPTIENVIKIISDYEAGLGKFALQHERYCVMCLSVKSSEELYQIAHNYLDETPELQKKLSKAINSNSYQIDYFLSEADTLIVKDMINIKICSHDAYGIDCIRNPLWTVYWYVEKHEQTVKNFRNLGFKTGDRVGIYINSKEKPTVYRL